MIRAARVFAREAAEFARRRGLLALAFVAPVVLLLLVGNLRVREPEVQVAIVTADAAPGSVAQLRTLLEQISGVRIVSWTARERDVRLRALEERIDVVAIPAAEAGWRFYTPLTSPYRLQLASAVVADVALSLARNANAQRELQLLERIGSSPPPADAKAETLRELEQAIRSGSALPVSVIAAASSARLVQWYPPVTEVDRSIVPGFIALIAVFLPFLLASAAVVKEREAGTLETLVLAAGRSWTRIAAGKIALPVAVALVTTLLLLVVARTAYGFGIKPGLAAALAVQLLAALVAALCGFGISTLVRSQQEAYLTAAVYLVGLILVTGMVYPIEQAAAPVGAVSRAFPLTFSGPALEAYMTQGGDAKIGAGPLSGLFVQLVAALALCALAIRRIRGSL